MRIGDWEIRNTCSRPYPRFLVSSLLFSSFAQLVFHAFTEPLFDHALIVEIPGAGKALNPRQHSGVNSEGDGDRFGCFTAAGDRGLHEAQVRPILRPEVG